MISIANDDERFTTVTPIAIMCLDCIHKSVCRDKNKALELEKQHYSIVDGPFKITLTCANFYKDVNTRGNLIGRPHPWTDYGV